MSVANQVEPAEPHAEASATRMSARPSHASSARFRSAVRSAGSCTDPRPAIGILCRSPSKPLSRSATTVGSSRPERKACRSGASRFVPGSFSGRVLTRIDSTHNSPPARHCGVATLGGDLLGVFDQPPVQRRRPVQGEPQEKRAPIRIGHGFGRSIGKPAGQPGDVDSGDVPFDRRPTQHVDAAMLDRDHLPILDAHQRAAFGPRLLRMSALNISRKHDPRPLGEHAPRVNVTERPVVVTGQRQFGDGARRIRIVLARSFGGGVQDTDIDQPRNRAGVLLRQILRHRAVGEGMPVQGDAQLRARECLAGSVREFPHIRRQRQIAGDDRSRVMIAA